MIRFGIFTRGRTGSTAIADELNKHPDIICHGEIFRRPKPTEPTYQVYEPGETPQGRQKLRDHVKIYKRYSGDAAADAVSSQGFGDYLAYLEDGAQAKAVGWKIIAASSGKEFFNNCRTHDVRLLNLRRQNIVRQLVSVVVARAVGIHNKRDYQPEAGRSFEIDALDIAEKARRTQAAFDRQDARIAKLGIPVITVFYEDWVADRVGFFDRIFGFLDVDNMALAPSTFSITTPEPLSTLISNYDAFAETLEKAGLGSFLNE